MIYYTYVESPVGPLLLTSNGAALTRLYMDGQAHATAMADSWIRDDDAKPFPAARAQLAAYFAGELTIFDLPLAPEGTDFQRRVWDALNTIPYGRTASYGEIARQVGNPAASRAVGLANGRNPIGIVVPCHRVIGANGKLVGYGGGLSRKESLLELETRVAATTR